MRIVLGQKGTNVDVMVMTATPIPRSLAMTAYGDLDHSCLDEKPAGRREIDTRILPIDRLGEVIEGLRRALGDGKRAYWICRLLRSPTSWILPPLKTAMPALSGLCARIHGSASPWQNEGRHTRRQP